MARSWNIAALARMITEDPDITMGGNEAFKQYADRSLSIGLVFSKVFYESTSVEDLGYDTIGDLDADYPIFMRSLKSNTDNIGSLTVYSKEDYADKGARLFKLKGIDAGFAVAGDGDIISVFNSEPKGSPYRGIGKTLMKLAKREGGNKLDHFDFPKLNEIYSAEGFEEYDQSPWDDQYAPSNWDFEKHGKPHLKYRRLRDV
jgi:hypothetical protein